MKTVNIHEAKSSLSKLLELVQDGEAVVIAKAGKPVASLIPYLAPKSSIIFGSLKGQISYDPKVMSGPDPEIQLMFYGDQVSE